MLRRRMERAAAEGLDPDPVRVRDLDRYIEVLTEHGLGDKDAMEMAVEDAGDEPLHHIAVHYERASGLWRAVRRNINKDGIFIQTDQLPSMGSKVKLKVLIKTPRMHFDIKAKVIWVNPHQRSGRPMGMGLKFEWVDKGDRQLFRSFLVGDTEVGALVDLGKVTDVVEGED